MVTRISFIPSPGAQGTYIEYKLDDGDWIVPSSAPNPTTLSFYDLTFTTAGTYTIRLSTISPSCTPYYKYVTVVVSASECCPVGYTLSPDATYCYIQNIVAATPPSVTYTTVAKSAVQYSTCGSYIYLPGYTIGGIGTSTQISPSNPFWVNGPGTCSDNNTTDGPLNRCGLWSSSTDDDQDVGFSICLELLTSKQYYIGIGCDNYGIIKLDGITIVSQNESAIESQYAIGGACFKVWHIYPIQIAAGPHILEILGHNIGSVAGMGAEIYDNTAGEIADATSYGDLNLIFSTKDHIGEDVSLGTDGYSCPPDYALTCESTPQCVQIITTPLIECP